MGLFSRTKQVAERREPSFAASASPENPATSLSNPAAWLTEWAGAGEHIGPPINERTAMAVSTVHACVRLIAGLIASLPLNVYRDTADGGRERIKDSREAKLLDRVIFPGRPITSFTWKQLVGTHMTLWGNAYAVIRYDGAGRIAGLEPVMPWNVEILRSKGQSWYRCVLEDGTTETLPHDEMLHFVGPSFQGLKGDSRIGFAREAIALAKTLEQQSAIAHENATRPSGMVSLPPGITPDGAKRMKSQFDAQNTGRANVGRVVWADGDAKFTQFQLTPVELATMDQRRHQAEVICQYFDIPPHMVDATDQTDWGTGVEQKVLAYLKFRFNPVLIAIESEVDAKLFGTSTDTYAQFNRDAMLAMDAKTSSEVQRNKLQTGVMLINEARRLDGRSPVKDGDTPLVNSTMISLERAITQPAPANKAGEAPAKDTTNA